MYIYFCNYDKFLPYLFNNNYYYYNGPELFNLHLKFCSGCLDIAVFILLV